MYPLILEEEFLRLSTVTTTTIGNDDGKKLQKVEAKNVFRIKRTVRFV